MANPDDLFALALRWHREGRGAALAHVVETWGSAPRQPGSQMVVDGQGVMEGSVSGGCVEAAVVAEAMDILAGAAGARVLEFGVSDADAFAVGLACGGRIRVLIEPVGQTVPPLLLEQLALQRTAGHPVAYVADLGGPARRLAGAEEFADRFRLDRSGIEPDGCTFVAVYNPLLRLIVVGAVHIAQPLAEFARACGYDLTIIDPRPAFATPARFPNVRIIDAWPDTALADLRLDARTAIVTLSHDAKIDDLAIHAALESKAFYIGCLGSRRTHARRLQRLTAAGVAAKDLARLYAPVGLDIGAFSPAEIAISIVAELTRVLRKV